MRGESLETTSEQLIKINEIELKNTEQDKRIQQMEQEIRKLKVHKKVLKEEVVSLRQQVNEQEIKTHNKTVALKSFNEFFNKQTEGLLNFTNES